MEEEGCPVCLPACSRGGVVLPQRQVRQGEGGPAFWTQAPCSSEQEPGASRNHLVLRGQVGSGSAQGFPSFLAGQKQFQAVGLWPLANYRLFWCSSAQAEKPAPGDSRELGRAVGEGSPQPGPCAQQTMVIQGSGTTGIRTNGPLWCGRPSALPGTLRAQSCHQPAA